MLCGSDELGVLGVSPKPFWYQNLLNRGQKKYVTLVCANLFYLSCLSHLVVQHECKSVPVRSNDLVRHTSPLLTILPKPQTHRFHKTSGAASLLVVLVMVLRWHLQVYRWICPLGELWVICVPGALAHRHLAASNALPVWVVHTDERGVIWRLVFTGRGGRGSGPGPGGTGRGEAVGSAGVQACYSHNLSQERHMVQTLYILAQLAVLVLLCS